MREGVKELWKICFPEDSDEFVELYFSSRYNDEITSVINTDGKIVSALQRIPYPMTYKGYIVPTSYISGACTHPSKRSLGLMTTLLKDAHQTMYNNGILFSTLIPANEELINFYKKSDYTIGFKSKEEVFSNNNHIKQVLSFKTLEPTESNIELIYKFIYNHSLKKSSCILHTFEDMSVITADHKLSEGEIWTGLYNNKEVHSIVFTIKEDDKLLIKEIITTNDNTQKETINFLLKHYNTNYAYQVHPCGMIRVINALELLKIYAHKSNAECIIEVYGDDTIPENNGVYVLSQGDCQKLKETSYKENLCFNHIKLNITELTEFLLQEEEPHMSLMLN